MVTSCQVNDHSTSFPVARATLLPLTQGWVRLMALAATEWTGRDESYMDVTLKPCSASDGEPSTTATIP